MPRPPQLGIRNDIHSGSMPLNLAVDSCMRPCNDSNVDNDHNISRRLPPLSSTHINCMFRLCTMVVALCEHSLINSVLTLTVILLMMTCLRSKFCSTCSPNVAPFLSKTFEEHLVLLLHSFSKLFAWFFDTTLSYSISKT